MYIGIALTEQRSSEIQVKVSVVVVLGSVFTRVHSFGDVFSTFWCLVLIFFPMLFVIWDVVFCIL